jgi:outer membrane protein TolC
MRATAGVWVPLVLILGCAGAGRYHRMTEDWQRADAAAPLADAGDQLFAGAAFLERGELVRQVLARNPNLRAASDAWRAALARYPQVTALDDPMFSYDVRPRSFGSDRVDPGNDFNVTQAIPFPGKLAWRGERALAEAESAEGDLEAQRVDLAALASRLYDAFWLAERAQETNAQHAALLDRVQRVALSRYASGSGSQQDVLAAQTEQGMLAHRERELASQRQIVKERLNMLLHRAPDLPLPSPPRELETPAAEAALDAATLVAHALAQHPELRAIEANVRAREAEVALARREFLPDFRVRGGYETSWQEAPLEPVVGVELNVPLQLGRRRAALDEAQAMLARDQSRARAVEDRVRFEVTSALERLRESQHLLEISQGQRLPPARDRVAGAQAAFTSGQITFLEFVDAERSLLAAEQEEFEVRANLSVRRSALARALGEIPGTEGDHP